MALKAEGLIDIVESTSQKQNLKLTLAGWSRFDQLTKSSADSDQVFVAMWFHRDMDTIYTDGIAPAVEACGLRPYRVDRAAHTNRIDAEIITEIRRSRFLVAEVTGERGGVYYEAGFAQGLGLPVIWCCNQSYVAHLPAPSAVAPNMSEPPPCEPVGWMSRMHFDTRQFPHILWNKAAELQHELALRIQMLGLARRPIETR